jgi:hypothetical protein
MGRLSILAATVTLALVCATVAGAGVPISLSGNTRSSRVRT